MKSKELTFVVVAAAMLLACSPILAHHGDAGRYEEKITVLKGTVVELQFTNPHTMIVFDVAGSGGKPTRWMAELDGTGELTRTLGWRKTTLKPGDKITITGRRVKSGSPYLSMNYDSVIAMTDTGKELFRKDAAGDVVAPRK